MIHYITTGLFESSPRRQRHVRLWSALSAQSVEDVIERFLLRLHVPVDVLQARRGRAREYQAAALGLHYNGPVA